MFRTRRLLFLTVLIVAAGAATSYLVAWCGELFAPVGWRVSISGGRPVSPSRTAPQLMIEQNAFAETIDIRSSMPLPIRPEDREPIRDRTISLIDDFAAIPEVGLKAGGRGWLNIYSADDGTYAVVRSRTAGWPFRCIRSYSAFAGPRNSQLQGGVDLSHLVGDGAPGSHTRVASWLPYWPGLIANTAIYGAIWLMPILAVFLWRQRSRRRAGACRACGYDLRGLTSGVCPECGNESQNAGAVDRRPA